MTYYSRCRSCGAGFKHELPLSEMATPDACPMCDDVDSMGESTQAEFEEGDK